MAKGCDCAKIKYIYVYSEMQQNADRGQNAGNYRSSTMMTTFYQTDLPNPLAGYLIKNQSVDKLKRSSLGGRIPQSIDLKIILEAEPNVIIWGIRKKSMQPERATKATTVFYGWIIKLSITTIS